MNNGQLIRKGHTILRDPNAQRWDANREKREADAALFKMICFDLLQQAGLVLKFVDALTLPASTWKWERSLAEAFPNLYFDFMGVEKDEKVYRKMSVNSSRYGSNFRPYRKPTSIKRFLQEASPLAFDLIYYDWMGAWSNDKKSDLDATFGCDALRPGGLLITNVMLSRGQPHNLKELKAFPKELSIPFLDMRGRDTFLHHPKVTGIPQWISQMAEEKHDMQMTPVGALVYYSQANHRSCPQLNIVMRRDG